jgi:hypothetical protein
MLVRSTGDPDVLSAGGYRFGGAGLSDRRHVDQVPVDEFDPVVRVQDAGVSHPVVIVHVGADVFKKEPPAVLT